MKFRCTFKDPDALHDQIRDAVTAEVEAMHLDEDEAEVLIEKRVEKVGEFCSRWIRYSEYITIEFDTNAGRADLVEDK